MFLFFSYRDEFDIASLTLWFKLNSGILIIPLKTDEFGIILLFGLPDFIYSGCIIFLIKGFSPEQKLFCRGKIDHFKTFGNCSVIIGLNLRALNIFIGSGLS